MRPSGRGKMDHLSLLEYCDQGNCFEKCTKMKTGEHKLWSAKELTMYFGQLCNAVSHLHKQQVPITHRDLKPENFLLQSKNGHSGGSLTLKLCDFGSAVYGSVSLETTKMKQVSWGGSRSRGRGIGVVVQKYIQLKLCLHSLARSLQNPYPNTNTTLTSPYTGR